MCRTDTRSAFQTDQPINDDVNCNACITCAERTRVLKVNKMPGAAAAASLTGSFWHCAFPAPSMCSYLPIAKSAGEVKFLSDETTYLSCDLAIPSQSPIPGAVVMLEMPTNEEMLHLGHLENAGWLSLQPLPPAQPCWGRDACCSLSPEVSLSPEKLEKPPF